MIVKFADKKLPAQQRGKGGAQRAVLRSRRRIGREARRIRTRRRARRSLPVRPSCRCLTTAQARPRERPATCTIRRSSRRITRRRPGSRSVSRRRRRHRRVRRRRPSAPSPAPADCGQAQPARAEQPAVRGAAGANLFIYHLPHDLTDADLATLFYRFGHVISAKVYIDKKTGESKGFGFVSFEHQQAAEAAISVMNGFQIGSKRLKVQHKRIGMGPGEGLSRGHMVMQPDLIDMDATAHQVYLDHGVMPEHGVMPDHDGQHALHGHARARRPRARGLPDGLPTLELEQLRLGAKVSKHDGLKKESVGRKGSSATC